MLWRAGLVLSVLSMGACDGKDDSGDLASDGSGGGDISEADRAIAEDLWDELSGYEAWGQLSTHSGVLASSSVHGSHVQVWFNDTALAAAEAGTTLPDGSVVVKEAYDDESGASAKNISVLKVISGYSSEHHDVFWAQYAPGGSLNTAGEAEGCYGCHEGADSNGDLVTLNE